MLKKLTVAPLAVLLLCALVILPVRLHTLHEPLEKDIATYAVYGHELLRGKRLYAELIDHKPPLIYWTFAAAEKFLGYDDRTVLILGAVNAVLTLVAIYAAGLTRNRTAAMVGAIAWTLVASDIPLQANQPNTEVFLNTLLAAGFVIVLQHSHTISRNTGIAAGVLFGLSTLYKQVTIIPILVFSGIYFCTAPGPAKKKIGALLPIGVLPAVMWILTFGYFSLQGSLREFVFLVGSFNLGYTAVSYTGAHTGGILANIARSLLPGNLGLHYYYGFLYFPLLTLTGILYGVHQRIRPWIYLAGYALSVLIMVALPGKWYPHYYQLWLPVFCIGTGWSVAEILGRYRSYRQVILAALVLIFLSTAYLELRYLSLSPDEISQIKYHREYTEVRNSGLAIRSLLLPDETFLAFGSQPGLYYYADKPLPAGQIFLTLLTFGSPPDIIIERQLSALRHNPPELVVMGIPTLGILPPDGPADDRSYTGLVREWMTEHYRESTTLGPGYMVRKGGRLDQSE